jgi:uncharacterized protein (TIGR03435 family)
MSSTSLPKVTRSVFSVAVFAAANAFRAYAQSGNGDLQFEVVSIKHSDPKLMGSVWRGGPGSSAPGRFTAENTTSATLASHAYGTKYGYELDWKSGWMGAELYDVVANVPAGATKEQFRIVLQRLLAERFGLVVHRETRQLPGYRLVVVAEGVGETQEGGRSRARVFRATTGRHS